MTKSYCCGPGWQIDRQVNRDRGYFLGGNRFFPYYHMMKKTTETAKRILDERTIDPDPIVQFQKWFREANRVKINLPNAMSVATASRSGQPSVRMVLLKDFDHDGFVFFTNYNSRKGRELLENPRVELMFWWGALERQVRIGGKIEKVTRRESDEYFHTRPRESQIGAHASPQSESIGSREELERKADELGRKFSGKQIRRPRNWGGYRVRPVSIEFWQGREARLHDRILYTKSKGTHWKILRLAP